VAHILPGVQVQHYKFATEAKRYDFANFHITFSTKDLQYIHMVENNQIFKNSPLLMLVSYYNLFID